MTKTGSVVAPESLSSSGRRNDVVAVDDRILKKGFDRERKWDIKTFGNNRVWKVNSLFGLRNGRHP